ncbi:MAG: XdhC/CoxI family protein [Dehalococcoidia bacterium]|nr:XdhC/CoxI family protein [Dehalococcoidia bacterium]
MLKLAQAILEAIAQNKAAALATVIESASGLPAQPGDKVLFLTEGEPLGSLGSTALDQALVERVATAIEERSSRTVSISFSGRESPQGGLEKAGPVDVFIEVFLPRPTLLVVGAGHIAVPLSKMAKLLEFEVIVLDDRASFANRERFPEADQVIAAGFEATLRRLSITRNTYIVLITRGHQHDVESLQEVIDSPAAYIGMIGSRRRVWAVFKLLHEGGMPIDKLKRIYAPIGLDIGAQTPAEIAASIMSEVVKVHRGGGVESISDRMRPRYIRLLEQGEDLEALEQEPTRARSGFSEERL